MSSTNTAVFGLYVTPATAEAAVDHLLACQGPSKTRPVGRSKSRPVVGSEIV
jgi:hypothetical protein